MRFKLPFAIFLALAILLAVGLRRDPKLLPSALDRQAGTRHRPAAAARPAADAEDRRRCAGRSGC